LLGKKQSSLLLKSEGKAKQKKKKNVANVRATLVFPDFFSTQSEKE
jgi:hypothetical protein